MFSNEPVLVMVEFASGMLDDLSRMRCLGQVGSLFMPLLGGKYFFNGNSVNVCGWRKARTHSVSEYSNGEWPVSVSWESMLNCIGGAGVDRVSLALEGVAESIPVDLVARSVPKLLRPQGGSAEI